MPRSGVWARRAALAVIAVGSVVWAVYLVWRLATPDQIGGLTSLHLTAILSLAVLPGATWATWRLDRQAAAAERGPPDRAPSPATDHDAGPGHRSPPRDASRSHRRPERTDQPRQRQ